MGFCTVPSCMEFNYRGTDDYRPRGNLDPYRDEIAKVESIIHDAFDTATNSQRLTTQPSNGDVWTWDASGTQLVFSPAGYLAIADEPATLSGVGWQTWVEKWLARGGEADYDDFLGGLSDAMASQNISWCSRCEVFAVHESGTGEPTSYVTSDFTKLHARWSSCLSGPVAGYLGGPPEPYLNVDASCQACPPHAFADGGVCTPCATGEVARGISCMACPSGTVPHPASNECIGCGPNEISENGVCKPCSFGRFADSSNNVCAICPADATVDVSSLFTCGPVVVNTNTSSVSNDPCPNDFWLEVTHLEAAGPKGCGYLGLSAAPYLTETEELCNKRDVFMEVFDSNLTSRFIGGASGVWNEVPSSGGSGGIDLDLSTCTYDLEHTIPGANLASLGSVRVLASAKEDVVFGLTRPHPATVGVQVGDKPGPL